MYNQKNMYIKLLPIILIQLATTTIFAQKVVRYDLYVKDTIVNFTGKQKRAIAVNGQIPMPTLTFTEGDTAEIHVHNRLKESTSLHWHGLYLPNKEDGVPYLTQMPIEPNTKHIYRFPNYSKRHALVSQPQRFARANRNVRFNGVAQKRRRP
jgi:hypothetical protein